MVRRGSMENYLSNRIKDAYEKLEVPNDKLDLISASTISDRNNTNCKREKLLIKKNPLLIAMVTLILLTTIGFSSYKIWTLQSNQGEILLEIKEFENGDSPLNLAEIEQIRKELAPGKAMNVFINNEEKNPQKIVTTLSNPKKYDSLDDIKSNSNNFEFKLPSFLPKGFKLNEGWIDYRFNNPDLNSMYREASITGEEIITQEETMTSQISGITITYVNSKGDEIVISISDFTGIRGIYLDDIKINNAVKLKKGDNEALYNRNNEVQQIRWVELDNENKTQYLITTDALNIHQQDLIKIAKSVN
jgi:hypothetical protein